MTPAQHRERAEALLQEAEPLALTAPARAVLLAEATVHALLSQPVPPTPRSRAPRKETP